MDPRTQKKKSVDCSNVLYRYDLRIDTPTQLRTDGDFSFPHQEEKVPFLPCLLFPLFFPAAAACCCVMAYLYTYFFLPQFDISRLHPKEFFPSYNCFVFDGIGVGREVFSYTRKWIVFLLLFPANQKCFFDWSEYKRGRDGPLPIYTSFDRRKKIYVVTFYFVCDCSTQLRAD